MEDNNKNRLPILVAIVYGIIIVITPFLSGQWHSFTLSLLAFICIPLPFIISFIAKIKKIALPTNFLLTSLLFNFSAQYLGEIIGFYTKFWWWDLLLHGLFGSYAVIIALYLIKGIIKKEPEITEDRFKTFKIIFAFSFSIALGTLWEMFEYIGDLILKTDMTSGGLHDTASDLLIKISFALVTCFIYYFNKL